MLDLLFGVLVNLQFLLLFIAAFSASAFKGALGAPFLAFTTSAP